MTSSVSGLDSGWRRIVSRAIVPASILYGVLSGIRLPSRWATTNLIFDYHFGFSKRALFGAVLAVLKAPPYPYAFLALIAYGILLVWLALLLSYFRTGLRVSSRATLLFGAFFSSVGFVFLVHEAGYLDHVGLLIALSCALFGSGPAGVGMRLALCSLGILVHEAFTLLFLPVVLADLWLVSRELGPRRAMQRVLTVAIPCALLTVWIGHYKVDAPQSAQVAYYNAKLRDSEIREDAIDPMHLGISDNLQVMAEFYRSPKYQRIFLATAVVVAPLVILYLWVANSILLQAGAARPWRLVVLAAGLSPLALNAFAWDEVRFISLTQVTSFLVVLSLVRRVGWKSIDDPRLRDFGVLAAAVIALSLSSEVTLFDGYTMQKFPFSADVGALVKTLSQGKPLLSAPRG